ncbi:MAG: hypothetical protein HYU68_02350 [Bacteroidetes bacterium]|nr:hypothetical protein [Bacteroidota bacterium]
MKTVFILFFVSIFCFSSFVTAQNIVDDSKKKTATDNTTTQKGANTVVKPTEKIQTTDHGTVIHQVDYKPEYPTPLFEQKPETLNPAQND